MESGWVVYGPENDHDFPYLCLLKVNVVVGSFSVYAYFVVVVVIVAVVFVVADVTDYPMSI